MMLDRSRPTIFGDGKQTRDFVFVDDVVDALVTRGGPGQRARSSTSAPGSRPACRSSTTRSPARSDFNEEPNHAPARPGELERSALDPGRAEIHLGWKPWTDLDTGVERTLDWFRTRGRARLTSGR